MALYNRQQLRQIGFERIDDGEECYYQYVIDNDDYFNSDFLYTELVVTGAYTVIRNSDKKYLTNTEVEIIVNSNGE